MWEPAPWRNVIQPCDSLDDPAPPMAGPWQTGAARAKRRRGGRGLFQPPLSLSLLHARLGFLFSSPKGLSIQHDCWIVARLLISVTERRLLDLQGAPHIPFAGGSLLSPQASKFSPVLLAHRVPGRC